MVGGWVDEWVTGWPRERDVIVTHNVITGRERDSLQAATQVSSLRSVYKTHVRYSKVRQPEILAAKEIRSKILEIAIRIAGSTRRHIAAFQLNERYRYGRVTETVVGGCVDQRLFLLRHTMRDVVARLRWTTV
ncbi:hypothetical protein LSAT2_021980 [Lamellibrachia satsuma]|nr:hypothetical protein LSAT2_021980 [Lamellibrachia satsuma]